MKRCWAEREGRENEGIERERKSVRERGKDRRKNRKMKWDKGRSGRR